MAEYPKPGVYGGLTPEERWRKWEAEKPEWDCAMWNMTPGYDFIPEVDVPIFHSFFFDAKDSIPPITPLMGYVGIRVFPIGWKAANNELSLPRAYGSEWRYKDGAYYIAFLPVRDEEEIKQREAKFKEAIRPYLEDFGGIWEMWKKKLVNTYDHVKQFDYDKARDLDFVHYIWELDECARICYEAHFPPLESSFSVWILLEEECKKRFGISDQSPEFQDMLRGFDNEIYQVDREVWLLSKQAVEMGLSDIFKENEPEAIIPKLEREAKGKEWVKKLMDFLQVRGWRMPRFMDFVDPYWLEKPSIPIRIMRDYIVRGSAARNEFILDERRRELTAKREKAVKAMMDKVPSQDKEWFSSMIKLCQWCSIFNEEHDLYCELMCHAVLRYGYLQIGRRLAEGGAIDRPEDVFMMTPMEMERVVLLPHINDVRWITRNRRAAWEGWISRFEKEGEFRPPIYTDRPGGFEEAIEKDMLAAMDPACIKVIVGELPAARPELKADIMGLCGCSGEAEGVARIIVNYEDLKDLQPGEILVCPGTNPAWTPAFGVAAAVIGDRGGTLSHTAVIGREYGVPTMVNTFVACQKIRTGQRIKVDATNGAIYILEE